VLIQSKTEVGVTRIAQDPPVPAHPPTPDLAQADPAEDDNPGSAGAARSIEPARPPRRGSRVRTAVKIAAVLAVTVIAYFAVRTRLPALSDVVATVKAAQPRWIAVAALAEALSIGMFAAQQRRLLGAFRVRMSARRALAVTFSRSAIAVALPAGSAVSAGFAYQQYRLRGASRPIASTVMILSALASTAGLILLYLGGLATVGAQWLSRQFGGEWRLLAAIVVLVLAVVGWWACRPGGPLSEARRRRLGEEAPGAAAVAAPVEPPQSTPDASAPAHGGDLPARVRRAIAPVGAAVREARGVAPRHWIVTLAYAVANWMLDLVCLVAVAHACNLHLGNPHLAAAYLAVQVVRQLPVTPGGIGLIETSLLAALVSAGAAQAPAAAVVLGYRLLSCWLIIPVGLLTWLGLRLPTSMSHLAGAPAGHAPLGSRRERRAVGGVRELPRGYGRRLSRLRNSGPGGVRRPRQRQPH
jgi:putative heme transporter